MLLSSLEIENENRITFVQHCIVRNDQELTNLYIIRKHESQNMNCGKREQCSVALGATAIYNLSSMPLAIVCQNQVTWVSLKISFYTLNKCTVENVAHSFCGLKAKISTKNLKALAQSSCLNRTA